MLGKGGGTGQCVMEGRRGKVLVVLGAGSGAVSNEDTKVFRGKVVKVWSNRSKISEMQQVESYFLVFAALSAGQGHLLSHQVSYTFI